MDIRAAFLIAGLTVFTASHRPATAQADPTPVLRQVISAFQMCGPPQVYQMFSPALFQAVSMQTGNSGCYADIRAAGPVASARVIDQRMFPIGPLYVVRVTHQNGVTADWFIGFNQYTSAIEYLNYQAAFGQAPTIATGPTGPTSGPSPQPQPDHQPTPPRSGQPTTPPTTSGDGCELYPAMCQ